MKCEAFRLKSRIERHSSLRRLGVGAVLALLVTSFATVVVAVTHMTLVHTDPVWALQFVRVARVHMLG